MASKPKRNAQGHFVARKKGTSTAAKTKTRTRTVTIVKKSAANGGGGGGRGLFNTSILPTKTEGLTIGGGAVYGFLERGYITGREKGGANTDGTTRDKAKAKEAGGLGFTVLDAIPKVIDGVGLAGNAGIAAWVLCKVWPNQYSRGLAVGTLTVAGYKLGARGEAFKKGTDISGLPAVGADDDDDVSGDEVGWVNVDQDTYAPD